MSGRFYVNPDITVSIRVYCLECLCPTVSAEGCKSKIGGPHGRPISVRFR
ncbi:hypothetical protein HMPREF2534_04709 [Bacteroides thetaiotaomicron]|nr:hypothetical protein HMPREF2534_04709 [Bacteroides thetaiotaomicron]